MTQLNFNQVQLDAWMQQARSLSTIGQLPSYIPRLAQVNPELFALQIRGVTGQVLTRGDASVTFPLMSVIKPFLLLYLLETLGEERIFQAVGREASELPFNSLEQLEADGGFPRNPMINSGAIALCALLPGYNACQSLCQWLNQNAQSNLFLDESMLESVRSLPNPRNCQIAERLSQSGYLAKSPSQALDTYERICCLSGTLSDLAQLGLLLADRDNSLQSQNREIVTQMMSVCGLYQYSAKFASEFGLPTKSSVSGVLLSIIPDTGAIALYSPPLDTTGNSVRGLFLLQKLVKHLAE